MSLGQGLCFFYSKVLLDLGHGLWTQWPAQLPVPCKREWLQIFLDQTLSFYMKSSQSSNIGVKFRPILA